MILIKQNYGDDLVAIENNIGKIIEEYFTDKDDYLLACINKKTLAPFTDDDPEVNAKPMEDDWMFNGSFPYHLKRTAMNYEDSDMAIADYLMALMSKYQKTNCPETKNLISKTYRAMIKLLDAVAEKNPYGAGFLPKPYAGIDWCHESFETSADQYFKFAVALEKYLYFTENKARKKKTTEILLAFAKWLNDRDFVTPYMGDPSYGRLNFRVHYSGFFAYIMALGYELSGNEHFHEEANFFRQVMLEKGKCSTSPNSLNLVVEILDRLIDLMPEHKEDWLQLMKKDWDNRTTYVDSLGISRFSGYTWNYGPRMASTYNTFIKYFPNQSEDLDLDRLLKKHHTVDGFIHQINADDPEDKTYYTSQFCLCSQSYANWLRGYWEGEMN